MRADEREIRPIPTAFTAHRLHSLLATERRVEHDATYRKQRIDVDSTRNFLRRVVLRSQTFSLILSGLMHLVGAAWTISVPRSSAQSAASAKPAIAPDLAKQFAKFKSIKIPFDSKDLTPREKKMVEKLVDAAGLLDCIYWRQSDPEGLQLYLSLMHPARIRGTRCCASISKLMGAATI